MSRCRPFLPRAQPQRLTALALSLAGHTLLYLLCCLPVQDLSTLRASEEEAHRSLSFLPPSLSHVVSRAFARCMLGRGASSRPWCFLIVTTSFTLSFRSNFFARERAARAPVSLSLIRLSSYQKRCHHHQHPSARSRRDTQCCEQRRASFSFSVSSVSS